MTAAPPLAALVLAALYLLLLVGKTALALVAARRERRELARAAPPLAAGARAGVTVAQAILGGDPRLAEVLAHNLAELPAAHFLWLVDTDDPLGRTTCEELRTTHPAHRIEVLVLPPPPTAHNPKLHKLALARAAMREPVLLVLDDDTRMPAATLQALLAALAGGATIATSLPGYLDDGRWPSRLLAQFVDNNAALTYLPLLPLLPPLTLNGMAYALRIDELDRLGGFAPLLGYLTDDLAVAERVVATGGRIHQSARPHWVQTTVRDGAHYLALMHRWYLFAVLLLRKQPVGVAAAISLLDGLPPALLLALVVSALAMPTAGGAVLLGAVLLARAALLHALQRHVYGRGLHAPISSLASELLQPLHLLHAACWRRIAWRTRRYRVRSDREFVECTPR